MRGNPILKWADAWLGIPACFVLGWIARLRDRDSQLPANPQRILIIKLSAVGDTVLLYPSLRALRNRYRPARVTWIASPVNQSVAELLAIADELRIIDVTTWSRRLPEVVRLVRELRREDFDLVIDFDQWSRLTALLSLLSGGRCRVGFATPGQGRGTAYSLAYEPPPHTHEARHFQCVAALAGAELFEETCALPLTPMHRARAAALVAGTARPRVAIHPGCGRVGRPRQWPPESYAAVADAFQSSHAGSVFLTGGADETEVVQEVAQHMGSKVRVLCGSFSFGDFAALLEQMDVVVCGNTGAMHIAAAVGTPTVALHGPTDPLRWGPCGNGHIVVKSPLPCSPCLNLGFEYGCRTHPCMRSIDVESVTHAVLKALHKRVPNRAACV